ncbi:SEFIR domain-containing protein [Mucilaginibacter pineti]|uniref:SEFIR domain-containing protein n=1 Tax=Mucilaginibacter pineti TaxID=1391627 RepID=A0A1G7NKB2_9SPHI|nr:toll/interleukin-1 receptor domain-containing protein [Mucilaginibacter pineti]SDF73729.1 SEFIR domain-containing protein [Mucilaginibacter pineti]
MASENKTKVFISYSWDNEDHKKWVITLADLIDANGGAAIVDRNNLPFGGHIKSFMLSSIMNSDIVLMILTPNYKRKADAYEGGAGYEYLIINDDLFKIITKNEKYIPIIRQGDLHSSATNFLQGFNCLDLRDGKDYEENLEKLIKQILKPATVPITNPTPKIQLMENKYKDVSLVSPEIINKSLEYFKQLFITDDLPEDKERLSKIVREWETEIARYNTSFVELFSPSVMLKYEDYIEDFKYKKFAKDLWTVGAALKTRDPDLAKYKMHYRDSDAEEIYTTVDGIIKAAQHYAETERERIDYPHLASIADLHMDFLDEDGMFMNRIIGFGIRSEILHRYFPAYFPIMTQPNLWAMYFIYERDNEFITVENRTRTKKMRVSHNWQYPYDRFAYLMNVIASELTSWFGAYGITLNPEYRFGYVNKFLSKITDLHKSDIRLLHEWVDSE